MKTRREFIKTGIVTMGGVLLSSSVSNAFSSNFIDKSIKMESMKKIKITNINSGFEREPLIKPLGFKGGYLSELWQTISYIESDSGLHSIGLGTQSVLWSDASIFSKNSEAGGNALMYTLTERALQMLKGSSFTTPLDIIDSLYSELFEYGKYVTCNPQLRKTFVLNALVAVDNALWLLYAKENDITNFNKLIPKEYNSTFSEKHSKVAAIPLISYNVSPSDLRKEVEQGYFFMKLKIGQAGTQQEMLDKDKKRLSEVHSLLKDIRIPYTKNGKLPYYFDANGRYESKDNFMRFLDYAKKIGAYDQIMIIEEPFPEHLIMDVTDIPVRLASDESAHTDVDTIDRIEMGYKAIALKPIAKTLSMTMKIAKAATDRNIPCFCADLTVNPILVEWNKNIASRLKSFPGIENMGLMESNGHQNYSNWEKMKTYLPKHRSNWIDVKNGFYNTNAEYYESGGGIFDPIPHYEKMFTRK